MAAPNSGCIHTHAAFYLWYGNPSIDGKWMHWDHSTLPHWTSAMNERYPPGRSHSPPDSPHSTFYPRRGLYSSADGGVLREQLRELSQAGVSSVMLSWWGQAGLRIKRDSQGVSTDERIPEVLDAASDANMSVSWHLEPYGGRSARSVRADLRYLHTQYGAHPAIWRQGVRRLPLVFLYDVSMEHAENDVEEWKEMVAQIRGSPEDAILLSLYHDRRDIDFVSAVGFDGAYSYFASDGATEGSTSSHWDYAVHKLRLAGKMFVASVGPGYDDTRIRPWNEQSTQGRERGAYYDRMWRAAVKANAAAITITSYNEWGEGTQIEPARPHTTSSGDTYQDYSPEEPDFYLRRTQYWTDQLNASVCNKRAAPRPRLLDENGQPLRMAFSVHDDL
mmetsp:Transcript_11454/g.24520  ORF Transcript_11454/g.24520 Transcript_11454/m.24520 type:complete len:390 (+) Transcript_11454:300-1469(+)